MYTQDPISLNPRDEFIRIYKKCPLCEYVARGDNDRHNHMVRKHGWKEEGSVFHTEQREESQ